MLNPIKRVFVPKPRVQAPEAAAPQPAPPPKRAATFDELPSPDMEEKDSDSVWAEFDSVKPLKPDAT